MAAATVSPKNSLYPPSGLPPVPVNIASGDKVPIKLSPQGDPYMLFFVGGTPPAPTPPFVMVMVVN